MFKTQRQLVRHTYPAASFKPLTGWLPLRTGGELVGREEKFQKAVLFLKIL